ncbi:hypothetical protein [Terrihalobacillus insolitus]|uniref:hypothetical protein n=1 Tax=Terrihalobacillus insolitus TaxID=2950438 RepID=UPI0023420C26|nr:hypothetical protein [Terrihalobacillus insolitus]MDC3414678.1 hypothetical protein [Terrihalobacillus insolitus]
MKSSMFVTFILTVLFISGCGLKEEGGNNRASNTVSAAENVVNLDSDISQSDAMAPLLTSIDQPIDQKAENVVETIFLNLLEKYNNMMQRVEPKVNYQQFSKEYVGYKMKSIETKEQFYDIFSDFMSEEATKTVWKDGINQGDEGVYLVPMDGQPKFDKNNPYQITKINDETYELDSLHKSELHGILKMNVTFEKIDTSWVISRIAYNRS